MEFIDITFNYKHVVKTLNQALLNEYVSLLNSLTSPPIAASVPKSRVGTQIEESWCRSSETESSLLILP